MITTPKLPFWVDSEGIGYPQIVNESGWVASAAENRIEYIVTACNYHERLRDALRRLLCEVEALNAFEPDIRAATGNTNWTCLQEKAIQSVALLAELAKEVQP